MVLLKFGKKKRDIVKENAPYWGLLKGQNLCTDDREKNIFMKQDRNLGKQISIIHQNMLSINFPIFFQDSIPCQ